MWNKRNDEPNTSSRRANRRGARPHTDRFRADGSVAITGADGHHQRTETTGGDRTFDDHQGRDSRAGGTAGGGRGGRTTGIAEPPDVGPNGKVRGNIKARQVAIFGSVRGNVEVTEKIAIREQGSLIGDIKGAGISIDDGAYFKGSIDIVRPEPKGDDEGGAERAGWRAWRLARGLERPAQGSATSSSARDCACSMLLSIRPRYRSCRWHGSKRGRCR